MNFETIKMNFDKKLYGKDCCKEGDYNKRRVQAHNG